MDSSLFIREKFTLLYETVITNEGVKMFAAILTITIGIVLATMVATICIDHDSTAEIVNWNGQQ